ncbi:MAG: nucleotidyl transferase [Rhodopirellula sp.]|nr:nucleotidyl transferase [Rhodopirellula sp.]
MKALLLSAGYGTRLRPLTYSLPKCLVDIGGKPLLGHWIDKLECLGCEEAIINTHYLAEQVSEYLKERPQTRLKLSESYEHELLGTAGSLLNNIEFFKGDETLLIHADNYTTSDLEGLVKAHKERPRNCLMTMLTFFTDTPSSCGIVKTNDEGIVQEFFEKVEDPPGNIANGAVYLFGREMLDFLQSKEPKPSDFSKDVLPFLLGRIHTWYNNETYIDIGTNQSLKKAQDLFSNS